jgi:hypothetical protein
MDRRELPVNGERRQENGGDEKPGKPWGFFLVLAAIVVVAIVYSGSIIALSIANKVTAETVFGAMAACFTVIGTLVGTYFGVKAGLDGQDKLKQTLARVTDGSRQHPLDADERNRDGQGSGQRVRGEQGERTWQGGSA